MITSLRSTKAYSLTYLVDFYLLINYIYINKYMPKRNCHYSDDDSSSDDSSFLRTQSTNCCEKCEQRNQRKNHNRCSRCDKPKKCDVCKCSKHDKCEKNKNESKNCEPEALCKDKKTGQCIVITIN